MLWYVTLDNIMASRHFKLASYMIHSLVLIVIKL